MSNEINAIKQKMHKLKKLASKYYKIQYKYQALANKYEKIADKYEDAYRKNNDIITERSREIKKRNDKRPLVEKVREEIERRAGFAGFVNSMGEYRRYSKILKKLQRPTEAYVQRLAKNYLK